MPRTSKGTRKNAKSKPQTLPATFHAGFLDKLDGRTELARTLRERFDGIASDLGGADTLSIVKGSLVERFVWLEACLVNIEAALAQAEDAKAHSELLSRWIQACNALLGVAKTIGIERQTRTLDLKSYVAGGNA